ncbi:hypothetical protein [Lentzea sp. NPDC060358]|uniref:hypothetical protein n=1 Tax=Lentzea sp. NPDC060358 TaxID=3347103 RepID=UPI003657AF79
MCFMFGAAEDHVARVLAELAEHAGPAADEMTAGAALVPPPAHARHSSSDCADPPP